MINFLFELSFVPIKPVLFKEPGHYSDPASFPDEADEPERSA